MCQCCLAGHGVAGAWFNCMISRLITVASMSSDACQTCCWFFFIFAFVIQVTHNKCVDAVWLQLGRAGASSTSSC